MVVACNDADVVLLETIHTPLSARVGHTPKQMPRSSGACMDEIEKIKKQISSDGFDWTRKRKAEKEYIYCVRIF